MSAPQTTAGDERVGTSGADGPPPRGERRLRPRDASHARDYGPGFFVKLALMAVVDALGVYVVWSAWTAGSYGILAATLAMLLAANWVYFSKRSLPLKYILPGLIFLLVYQIFVVGYTGYVAFTNYGTGHNSTKEQAVSALLIQNERRVEGSASSALTV
ncbi:MAG: ABC transporter permease subunit, partial [Cellulosimicrobium funkei]